MRIPFVSTYVLLWLPPSLQYNSEHLQKRIIAT